MLTKPIVQELLVNVAAAVVAGSDATARAAARVLSTAVQPVFLKTLMLFSQIPPLLSVFVSVLPILSLD